MSMLVIMDHVQPIIIFHAWYVILLAKHLFLVLSKSSIIFGSVHAVTFCKPLVVC